MCLRLCGGRCLARPCAYRCSRQFKRHNIGGTEPITRTSAQTDVYKWYVASPDMAAQLLVRHVQARGDFPGSEKGLSGLLVCGALAHLLPWFSVGADTPHRYASLFCPVDHVSGASAAGKGDDEIRLAFVEHALVADGSGGFAV